MEVTVSEVAGMTVVRPHGPVDSLTADDLQRSLLDAIARHGKAVTLDFSAVPYLSSSGLRVLAIGAKAMRAHGVRLAVGGVQPSVLSVLTIANFTSFLDVTAGTGG